MPTFTSISPVFSVLTGDPVFTVTITGTGFVDGATVVFVEQLSGGGIPQDPAVFVSDTELTVSISPSDVGIYNVVVTNPDATTVTGTGAFLATGQPTFTAVVPDTLPVGATETLEPLYGGLFVGGVTVTVSGSGVTVNSVAVISNTELSVSVTAAGDADQTARDLIITNPDGGGSVTATGALTVTAGVAPTIDDASISGSTIVGDTVTCDPGPIGGSAPVTVTYAWYNNDGYIDGATSATYVCADADVGFVLGCQVTATNDYGTDGDSPQTGTDVTSGGGDGTPTNTVLPVITGTTVVGETLTCGDGTWTGDPTITYTYEWNGTAGGSTTQNYVCESGDIGNTLSCTVTGTNGSGNSSATSDGTADITSGGGGGGGISISSLSPSSFDQGTTGNILVVGSGFVDGIVATCTDSDVTVNSTSYTDSNDVTVNITVAVDATAGPAEITLTNPDTTTATGSVTITVPVLYSLSSWRWVLTDPAVPETYTLEINPNQGGSLPLQKNVSIYQLTADDSEMVLYEGSDTPQLIVVTGTLLTETAFNGMVYWYSKRRPVQLTDDLGRTMWIYCSVWTPTRSWSYQYPWKHTYSLSYYVVGQQAVTTL